jgi:hypothetical protein
MAVGKDIVYYTFYNQENDNEYMRASVQKHLNISHKEVHGYGDSTLNRRAMAEHLYVVPSTNLELNSTT